MHMKIHLNFPMHRLLLIKNEQLKSLRKTLLPAEFHIIFPTSLFKKDIWRILSEVRVLFSVTQCINRVTFVDNCKMSVLYFTIDI